jgi:hypothetical protein
VVKTPPTERAGADCNLSDQSPHAHERGCAKGGIGDNRGGTRLSPEYQKSSGGAVDHRVEFAKASVLVFFR